MALEKVGRDRRFLDMRYPNVDLSSKSIAYLVTAKPGYTKGDVSRPFITLYLRDYTGNLVMGWMFDIKETSDVMVHMADLSRRPVQVSYRVRERDGNLSLMVESVVAYTEPDFPYEQFMGKIEDSAKLLSDANTFFQKYLGSDTILSREFENESFLTICEGRQGGYTKLIYSVVRALATYTNTPSVDRGIMLEVAYRGLELYARHLRNLDKVKVPLKHELQRMVFDEASKGSDVQQRNILSDALGAILGLHQPEHLYAIILHRELKQAEFLLSLCYQYPLMVDGSTRILGDGTCLAKY